MEAVRISGADAHVIPPEQRRMESDGVGWRRMEADGSGWKRLEMDSNGQRPDEMMTGNCL